MKLNLSSICECLPQHFSIVTLVENNKEKLYPSPKLFVPNTSFEKNNLYIIERKNLPASLYELSDIAIICIGEGALLGVTKCSLLQIKETVSIVEVYAAIVEIYQKYNMWENELIKLIGYRGDLKKQFLLAKLFLMGISSIALI